MPQCRCKMCGGIINYNNDQKVAVCEFCDTEQTIVNGDNEIKINLFKYFHIEYLYFKCLLQQHNVCYSF